MPVDLHLAGRLRIRPVVAVCDDNTDPQGEKLALSQALDGRKTFMAIPFPAPNAVPAQLLIRYSATL
jgi:hypothetical protein